MSFTTLVFEQNETTGIATVTLNRPAAMNAITQTMLEDFDRLWTHVRADETINAVVLRANLDSRAFTSGADVSGSDPFKRSDNVFANKGACNILDPK